MRTLFLSCFACCLLLAVFGFSWSAHEKSAPPVRIVFNGVERSSSAIWVAVYNSYEDFNAPEKAVKSAVLHPKNDRAVLELEGLPSGKYAIVAFQDLDNNQELTKNFIGFPKEPIALSNNPTIRFRPPNFNDCAIQITDNQQDITLTLKEW